MDIISALLEHGADIEKGTLDDEGHTALLHAATLGSLFNHISLLQSPSECGRVLRSPIATDLYNDTTSKLSDQNIEDLHIAYKRTDAIEFQQLYIEFCRTIVGDYGYSLTEKKNLMLCMAVHTNNRKANKQEGC